MKHNTEMCVNDQKDRNFASLGANRVFRYEMVGGGYTDQLRIDYHIDRYIG